MSNKREILKMSAVSMKNVAEIDVMSDEEVDRTWERIKKQGEQIVRGRR